MENVYVPTGIVSVIDIRPLELLIATPDGAPESEKVIGCVPTAVIWNESLVPLNVPLLLELVMAGATGAAETVTVNVCDASGDIPLAAVTVKE